jgi:DNA-binding transcriptional LysR family regulator
MDMLVAGYRRNEVARRLRITPPAITQRMQAVRNRWQAFQAS